MGIHELSLPRRRTVALPRVRLAAYPTRLALGAIVGVSWVLRSIAAFGHSSPRYFPDEYIYSQLARSIAEGKGLQIRGGAAHFPALLEPLLAAPFWLTGDVARSYQLTLVWHSLAMSLAAIPVYKLSRRLDLSERVSLGTAAIAVALPSLSWASFLTADAIAYPLALSAVYAIVSLLDRPSRLLQVVVPVLCGAVAFARVQYVVLPAVFVVAAIVLERGRPIATLRRYPLALTLFALPVVAASATGPDKILGYYGAVTSLSLSPGGIAHWFGVDVVLLALATGVVLAPAAVVGGVAALARPRSRSEAAFGVVSALFAAALFFEAALYASNGSERFQERYLMSLAPLVAPAFALGIRRSGAWRLLGGGVALGVLTFCARVPLTGYAIGTGKQDSPFLLAVYQLQQWAGGSTGALIASALGSVLAVAGASALVLRGRGVAIGLGSAFAVLAALSFAATTFDHAASNRSRITDLPGDKQWIDHSRIGSADILLLPDTPRAVTPTQLFWNKSLRDVLALPHADPPDAFRQFHARIAPDGTLMKGGRAERRPILVEQYLGRAELQNATAVRTTLMSTLWRPNGVTRFSWLARGRYFDGWLSSSSSVTVWPDRSGRVRGTLKLALYLPGFVESGSVRLTAPAYARTVRVRTGSRLIVRIPVDSSAAWTLRMRSTALRFLPDGRDISVRSLPPVFTRASALKPTSAPADRG